MLKTRGVKKIVNNQRIGKFIRKYFNIFTYRGYSDLYIEWRNMCGKKRGWLCSDG